MAKRGNYGNHSTPADSLFRASIFYSAVSAAGRRRSGCSDF